MAVNSGDAPLPVPLLVQLPPPGDAFKIFEDVVGAGPGGAVWDAAVVLAQYVHSLGDALRGAAVVELGAGAGLPGLVAARHGADVVLTDRTRALPLLRRNAAANGLTSVSVLELEWGPAVRVLECVACRPAASKWGLGACSLVTRRAPHSEKRFALVLAADVVCHEESFEPLLFTLQALAGMPGERCLSHERAHADCSPRRAPAGGAEVLLCNKCRDVAEHAFWRAAAEHFHIEILQEGMPAAPRDGDDLPVLLYRLWAKNVQGTTQRC